MVFELDRREAIYFEECFITEAFFVLRDRQPIPNVTILNDIVFRMKGKMGQNAAPKVHGPRQEILREVLRNTCHPRPFQRLLRRQDPVAGRQEMDIHPAIDEPANVMQNMGRCPLGTRHDVKGSIENTRHERIIRYRLTGSGIIHQDQHRQFASQSNHQDVEALYGNTVMYQRHPCHSHFFIFVKHCPQEDPRTTSR